VKEKVNSFTDTAEEKAEDLKEKVEEKVNRVEEDAD
jgi:hypothetical protein